MYDHERIPVGASIYRARTSQVITNTLQYDHLNKYSLDIINNLKGRNSLAGAMNRRPYGNSHIKCKVTGYGGLVK